MLQKKGRSLLVGKVMCLVTTRTHSHVAHSELIMELKRLCSAIRSSWNLCRLHLRGYGVDAIGEVRQFMSRDGQTIVCVHQTQPTLFQDSKVSRQIETFSARAP